MGLFDIFRVGKIKAENNSLKQQLQELHADEYFQVKARLNSMTQEIVDNNALISKQHEELSSLTERSQKLSMRENRIKEAYEAGVDTLEEYKSNKDRLVSDRLELTAALSQLLQEEQSEQPNTEEILKEIRSVADVLKNPDVGYEEKGNLIRSVVEQIIYDKESGKMSFDIIIS